MAATRSIDAGNDLQFNDELQVVGKGMRHGRDGRGDWRIVAHCGSRDVDWRQALTNKGIPMTAAKGLSISMKKRGKWRYIRDTWNADGAPVAGDSAAPAK